MAFENQTDVQRIQVTVNQNSNGVRFRVTHNLVDQYGHALSPDEVKAEIVGAFHGEEGPGICSGGVFTRILPATETGFFDLELRLDYLVQAAQGITFVVQVTSTYHHSIQTHDHVANGSTQNGTQIYDCADDNGRFPFDIWHAGCLAHWNGHVWNDMRPLDVTNHIQLHGVWAIADDDVWVVGSKLNQAHADGYVAHWDGANWDEYGPSDGFVDTMRGVYGNATNNVWVCGDGGVIAVWTGAAWTLHLNQPEEHTYNYYGCYGTAAANMYFVGEQEETGYAHVARWTGAAYTNKDDLLAVTSRFYNVWAKDATHVYVVGDNNGVGVQFMHSGTTWGAGIAASNPLYAIHGDHEIGRITHWVVGEGGYIAQFSAGVFTVHNDGTDKEDFHGIFVYLDHGIMWACGDTSIYMWSARHSRWVLIDSGVTPNTLGFMHCWGIESSGTP
jgi:hypothetical protein